MVLICKWYDLIFKIHFNLKFFHKHVLKRCGDKEVRKGQGFTWNWKEKIFYRFFCQRDFSLHLSFLDLWTFSWKHKPFGYNFIREPQKSLKKDYKQKQQTKKMKNVPFWSFHHHPSDDLFIFTFCSLKVFHFLIMIFIILFIPQQFL